MGGADVTMTGDGEFIWSVIGFSEVVCEKLQSYVFLVCYCTRLFDTSFSARE